MRKLLLVAGATVAALATASVLLARADAADDAAPPPADAPRAQPTRVEDAIFAGGCFWCVEADLEKLPGVIEAVSGYTGGHVKNPSYEDVTYLDTGHKEAVRVRYDADVIDYETLVSVFLRTIDVTDDLGQFCDKGASYRTAIFALDADQRAIAEAEIAEIEAANTVLGGVVTPVLDAGTFYRAEGYHQDYYKKNPVRYSLYRRGCGRDARLRQIWGDDAMGRRFYSDGAQTAQR
ncbi:MAG: peptide-methionine (S)-S-oxide reductase MsrA [Maricaulaceae bacterium]